MLHAYLFNMAVLVCTFTTTFWQFPRLVIYLAYKVRCFNSVTPWPNKQKGFLSLDEESSGEARRPSGRASSAPWHHPETCFFCLAVHLTMNAFSPVGKEKEEVKVNTYQRCDPDLLTLLPLVFCWPSLCHMASARWTETWTCFSPMGQKTECQGDGLTEKEEKGTVTFTCLWHRVRGMMSTRGH